MCYGTGLELRGSLVDPVRTLSNERGNLSISGGLIFCIDIASKVAVLHLFVFRSTGIRYYCIVDQPGRSIANLLDVSCTFLDCHKIVLEIDLSWREGTRLFHGTVGEPNELDV
jgi:hypothetical protein